MHAISTFAPQPAHAPDSLPSGRLLIVEPDGDRAALLRRVLRPVSAIDLRIVPRVTDAIRAMAERIPDLVMTSPLLAPGDEAVLWTEIRRTVGASHVQIINLPYAIDAPRTPAHEASHGSVFQFRRRSSIKPSAGCDVSILREEIAQYLARAVACRDEANAQARAPLSSAPRAIPGIVLAPATAAMMRYQPRDAAAARDRRRAARRSATDLRGLWTVRLPWGSDVRLVDISNTGVLFESASKISPGVTVDLQILGEQRKVFVPARLVRADVAQVDAFGVKYRMAAEFGCDVRLMDFDAAVGLSSPRVLTDLLTRVLTGDGPATPADVSRRFESELQRLLPGRDVEIRVAPPVTRPGKESIYFTLEPQASSPRILQVTFEPDSPPTPMEFRLLKTAAKLAAVALEIAQFSKETR
jgi:PilZ domain-containing protein